MKTRWFLLALLLTATFVGCSYTSELFYSFRRGESLTATVGSDMVTWTVDTHDWHGILVGRFEESLTYTGMEGTTLHINYSEMSDGYARPAFSQALTYDIAKDSVITFRHTIIRIESASSSSVTFTVLDSPTYKYENGAEYDPSVAQ